MKHWAAAAIWITFFLMIAILRLADMHALPWQH